MIMKSERRFKRATPMRNLKMHNPKLNKLQPGDNRQRKFNKIRRPKNW